MAKKIIEKIKAECKDCSCNCGKPAGSNNNAVYGLGLIGALVYYLGSASSFAEGLMGILKSLIWPALLVHKALELLHF